MDSVSSPVIMLEAMSLPRLRCGETRFGRDLYAEVPWFGAETGNMVDGRGKWLLSKVIGTLEIVRKFRFRDPLSRCRNTLFYYTSRARPQSPQ